MVDSRLNRTSPYHLPSFIHFSIPACSTQHPNKPLKGPNCDRYAYSTQFIAVADGVNSVANEGINPTRFPTQLLAQCVHLIRRRCENKLYFDDVTTARLSTMNIHIQKSVPNSISQFLGQLVCRAAAETHELGASTLCLGLVDDSFLHVANVGDSGMCVFRLTFMGAGVQSGENQLEQWRYQLVCQTTPGLSKFNTPYQIMRMEVDGVFPSDADVARGVVFGMSMMSVELEVRICNKF